MSAGKCPRDSNPQELSHSLNPANHQGLQRIARSNLARFDRLLQRRACFEATGVAWKSVAIARTKGGKPYMANKPAHSPAAFAASSAAAASSAPKNWNFNVSHEGKYVVLAGMPRKIELGPFACP